MINAYYNLLYLYYISNNFSMCRQCVKHTYLKKSRLIKITVAGNCNVIIPIEESYYM